MPQLTILGAGSWGSALAMVLAENGHEVTLWSHNEYHAQMMQETRQNTRYLEQLTFPENVTITADLATAVRDAALINFVVPTKAIRQVAQQIKPYLKDKRTDEWPIIMHSSKGLEQKTYLRISEVLTEELNLTEEHPVVVLSGPSHAEEVANHDVTAITAASQSLEAAERVQQYFMTDDFRVYTNRDVIGVETGGALKNIIALGAGILAGTGYGDNAKAALVTRGLAEISRLGIAVGADPLTFMGLSGVGDLIVTATSSHSRNWRAGYQIGQGAPIDTVEEQMGMVVEGMATTIAGYEVAQKLHVEMPITTAIYEVITEQTTPQAAIQQLMRRDKKGEVHFTDLQSVLTPLEQDKGE